MEQHTDTTTRAARPKSQPRLWTHQFILLIVITFATTIVAQGLNTGLAVYVDRVGGTATFAGLLSTVFAAAAISARFVIGPAIDSRGRKIVMVVGLVIVVIGAFTPAVIPCEATLVIGRALQGVGYAASSTAVATAAADVLPPERMGEGISYSGLGNALATSIGPAFALYLVSTDPAENLFFVLAAIAVINIGLSMGCRYEKHPEILPEESSYRRKLASVQSDATDDALDGTAKSTSEEHPEAQTHDRLIDRVFEPCALPGAIPILFMSAAFGFTIVFAGLYGTSLGIENAGLFYTLSAISMIVVRLKSKAFMDTVLPIKIYTVSVFFGFIAFGMLLAAPALPLLFYLAGLPYGLFLGIGFPLNQAVVVKNTPPERWGVANSLYYLANDVGIGVTAAIWGVTNDLFGFSVTLMCCLACITVSYVLAWIAYPADAKRSPAKRSK